MLTIDILAQAIIPVVGSIPDHVGETIPTIPHTQRSPAVTLSGSVATSGSETASAKASRAVSFLSSSFRTDCAGASLTTSWFPRGSWFIKNIIRYDQGL